MPDDAVCRVRAACLERARRVGYAIEAFKGHRIDEDRVEVQVVVDSGRLLPLEHVVRHSPTGMEWGYNGSGPADLALSIVAALAPKFAVPWVYQVVKERLVAPIGGDAWEIPAALVEATMAEALASAPQGALVEARVEEVS